MEKGTVVIGIDYLEMLIRDSEKVRMMEDMLERSKYTNELDFRIILGMPEKKEGE